MVLRRHRGEIKLLRSEWPADGEWPVDAFERLSGQHLRPGDRLALGRRKGRKAL